MATLKINLAGVEQLRASLERLQGGELRRQMLHQIGARLRDTTSERFETKKDPSGIDWKALAKGTLRRKKNRGRILVETGNLMDSIDYEVEGDTVSIGTSLQYGGLHQFGGVVHSPARQQTNLHRTLTTRGGRRGQFVSPKARLKSALARSVTIPAHDVTIPARPFLGLSKEDKVAIERIVLEAARKALKGR